MPIRQAMAALAASLCLALSFHAPAGATEPVSPGKASAGGDSAAPAIQEEIVYSLIVTPHRRHGRKLESRLAASDAAPLEHATHVRLRVARRMSGGSHVIQLPQGLPLSEARALAARLMQDASVEMAEPDRIVRPASVPNDPAFLTMQWNLQAPAGANKGGANLPLAWDMSSGAALVTVAVLDGGYVPHTELTQVLPGYDFLATSSNINGTMVANGDGNGRDSDATDPGNGTGANECGDGLAAVRSTWHGTHVAGIISASMNNGRGGAGVAPGVRILPVRVLGRCGGPISDIVDGMRWAAGLYAIPGVGANPNPARILNMSLGSSGSCSNAFQSAVTDVVNAGKLVVAAAGNDSGEVTQPGNCNGAIAVAAHSVEGDLASYSNSGSRVTISAPGGGCGRLAGSCLSTWSSNGVGVYSLSNAGTAGPVPSPGGDSYAVMTGTSMAAPHVSGVIALMLSLDPGLSRSQIVSYLRASARPFPAGSTCTQAAYAGRCGAGMLDAAAALSIIAPDIQMASNTMVVPPMTYVTLSANITAPVGRTVVSTTWAPLPGNPTAISLDNAATPNAGFNAPVTGSYGFVVTAVDSAGKSASDTLTVRVNSPPVVGSVDPQTASAGQALHFQLRAVDRDGDAPVFFASELPPGASLSSDGSFSWPSSRPGSYALTYYATDNDASSTPGTVNINVNGSLPGGGAMGAEALLGLGLLAAALQWCRRQRRGK